MQIEIGVAMVRSVAVLVFTFLSQSAFAALATEPPIQRAAKFLLAKLHPEKEVTSLAVGDLNGDGVPDVAYVVEDGVGTARVGVLRGRPGGALNPWSQSRGIRIFTTIEVDIRRRSLFIEKYYASRTVVNNYEAQFQYRKRELVCIGLKETHQSPIHDDEPGPKYWANSSTNNLTAETISRIENDGHVSLSRKKESARSLVKIQDWGDEF